MEVLCYAGETIPRDGLVCEGKAFIDESMMTGESNPYSKIGGSCELVVTGLASDKLRELKLLLRLVKAFLMGYVYLNRKCYKT